MYNTSNQINFKTSMLRSSLCDYSDAYILVIGTITIADAATVGGNSIQVVFKCCTQFTNCMREINNTQINNVKNIDVVMEMYNLLEFNNIFLKTSQRLWQQYRDGPDLKNDSALKNCPSNSVSFKFKQKIIGSTDDADAKAVQIMIPLKYICNFYRTLEMLLIDCEINVILTLHEN